MYLYTNNNNWMRIQAWLLVPFSILPFGILGCYVVHNIAENRVNICLNLS